MTKELDELDKIKISDLRPIPGYDNYFASRYGEIIGFDAHKSRWTLKTKSIDPKGYYRVSVCVKNKIYRKQVSRLVCLAFYGIPKPDDLQTRHLNGLKTDDKAVNLSWGTFKDQVADKKAHGTFLRGDIAPWSKLKSAQVLDIRKRLVNGERGCDLAKVFGVTYQTISDIKRRKKWTHI